jgi:hypothetical protein
LTHDSSTPGQLPSVATDNTQQIKHIGATVGTLAKEQEDRFQKLEHQLDLLADKLDDLAPADPQFTPPKSPGLSDSVSCRSDTSSISSRHFDTPRILRSEMAPATVADIGGYFYPNYDQHGDTDQQYISDAYTFVGRVKRTRQTKSVNNIEIFLRGSALRWFHIGLRSDGIHIYDMMSGKFDLGAFCKSLISLFGVPKSLTTVVHVDSLHLIAPCMRSDIIEDYIFPALEYLRPQEDDFSPESGANTAVSNALALYKQSSEPCSVRTEIFDPGATFPPETSDGHDLQCILGSLRRCEFEQKLDRALSRNQQHLTNVASSKEKRGNQIFNRVKQEPIFAFEKLNIEPSTMTPAKSQDSHMETSDTARPEVKSASSTVEMPEHVESEVAGSVVIAIEPYLPAPTADSCPATPIASYQPPSRHVDQVPQITNVCDGTRVLVATQPGVVDPSILITPEMAKKFGFQPGCQPYIFL